LTEIQQELRHAGRLFWSFIDFVLAWIAYGLYLLRESIASAGVPPWAEKAVLVAVVVTGVAVVLRLLRGLLRIVFAAVVALLAARANGLL